MKILHSCVISILALNIFPIKNMHAAEKKKADFQTRMDPISQRQILNTVIAFHRSHYPEYLELVPTAARVVKSVEYKPSANSKAQSFELWQYSCKDKIFVHLISINEIRDGVFIFAVVQNEKFPKVVPA